MTNADRLNSLDETAIVRRRAFREEQLHQPVEAVHSLLVTYLPDPRPLLSEPQRQRYLGRMINGVAPSIVGARMFFR